MALRRDDDDEIVLRRNDDGERATANRSRSIGSE